MRSRRDYGIEAMTVRPMRESVRVEFHLSGGYTRVVYERVQDCRVEIPTAAIPDHLRPIGSRFIVVFAGVTPDEDDTIDELRVASQIRVEELAS
jgi:hypothetical protein